jgi:hypothetical protein
MAMQWFSNLKSEEDAEYLALFFFGQKYRIYSFCIEGVVVP